MKDIKGLAIALKVLRAKKGLSQIELANKSGISVSTITFIESCRKVPRIETLLRLAKALSCDEEELLKYIK